MKIKAIQPDKENKILKLIDQRILPVKLEFFLCKTSKDCYSAIKDMIVRGAPAIGITAAFAAYYCWIENKDYERFKKDLLNMKNARPTAVNLMWAVDNILEDIEKRKDNIQDMEKYLWQKAEMILQEDIKINESIGKNGAELIKKGMNILTHCNAGALATGGYGTALGVIRAAWEKYNDIHVWVDETRPYLQGARLTAWEMHEENIPYTMICDNMAGFYMSKKKVDFIVTGADRIASNGDTANKIGTYSLAVLAKYHNIPFYIAAPLSTFDIKIHSGKDIPIEMRNKEEVIRLGDNNITFEQCNVNNPSFDVTPASLITGIITEKGVIREPYKESIKNLFKG